MNFSLYIAKRYLFSKSGNNTINIITIIASFGVIVGTLALFIILSGFSGFKTFTNSLLEFSDPDIRVSSQKGKTFLYTDALDTILSEQEDILSSAKVIEERVFLQYKEKSHIAFIKGVSTNYSEVTNLEEVLSVGQWLDSTYINSAVIGYGISDKLSLGIMNFGDPLEIKVPTPGTGLILSESAAFNTIETQIVGVYNGSEEFANKYVYVDLLLANKLLEFEDNQLTTLEIKLKENVSHTDFAAELGKLLGDDFKVETRMQFNALTYKVLNTENLVSYFIFTLIIIIAFFNVIGAMIMMIIDKKKNLKTLFNLGVDVSEIKKIFVFQGFLLTLFGLFIGLLIGLVLILVQQKFQLFMITQTIPYPVEFRLMNVLVVSLTISILGYIASKIASSRISSKFIEK